MDLTRKHHVPLKGGMSPMPKKKAEEMLKKVPGWHLMQDAKKGQLSIGRGLEFNDFRKAIAFVNKVAAIAESEGHHPDIHVFYSRVKLELWTHAIGGLSEDDFILAAEINKLPLVE